MKKRERNKLVHKDSASDAASPVTSSVGNMLMRADGTKMAASEQYIKNFIKKGELMKTNFFRNTIFPVPIESNMTKIWKTDRKWWPRIST